MTGTLFVVATPLGNLDDISGRALEVLRSVACIACEDTRRTGKLLTRFAIGTTTVSCHKFNERERLAPVLDLLRRGSSVALVSDGGTPAISDPGALLVRAARAEGIRVVPIPGPSALIALLSTSGLPADRFVFDGFLPHREGERRRRLRDLAEEERTLVFYEAPHRIRESLRDLGEVFGARRVVLGRELTKLHETVLEGTPGEVLEALGDREIAGEIVFAVAGFDPAARGSGVRDASAGRVREAWREALGTSGGDRREAIRSAARVLGMKRPELQRRLAEIGED